MDEPHRSLERPGRPRHPRVGEQRRGHGRPRRVRRGGALPHRELAGARLTHRRVGDRRARRRLERRDREPEETAGTARGGDADDVHVIPAPSPQAHRVAERHTDLVGHRDRLEERGAPHAAVLGAREQRRDGVGGMERLERQVRVVEVQTPNRHAVRETRGLDARARLRSPDGDPARRALGVPARGDGRRFVESRDGDAEGVEHPSADLVRGLGREAVRGGLVRVPSEDRADAIGQRHPSLTRRAYRAGGSAPGH